MKKLITLLALTLGLIAKEKPNIVVIISDDQGYHDYGFMGHEHIKTPHLDKLASESLVYERGYVTTALCCPSLATMLTGMYPHQHGYTGNDPVRPEKGGKEQAPAQRVDWVNHFRKMPQLPALLAENGYLSLHTGKYWQMNPRVSGFTHSMGETLRHGSEDSLNIGRTGMQPIYDFIAEAQEEEKPFLVWYAPFLPHTPHTPPQRLLDKYAGTTPHKDIQKYYAMVDWLDETCGELLGHIEEKGLTENTIIFYLCDNGWAQGRPGYRGHKLTPYEQGVRTPIMIKWPGKVEPKREKERLASNLDLVPTLLSAVGAEKPEVLEGIDLLDQGAVSARDTLYLEDFSHDMISPERPGDTIEARAIIKGWDKYLETYDRDKKTLKITKKQNFLFHLQQDEMEKTNLVEEKPELVKSLKSTLDAWYHPEIKENPRGL